MLFTGGVNVTTYSPPASVGSWNFPSAPVVTLAADGPSVGSAWLPPVTGYAATTTPETRGAVASESFPAPGSDGPSTVPWKLPGVGLDGGGGGGLPTLSFAVRGARPASGELSSPDVLSEQATENPAAEANRRKRAGRANRFIIENLVSSGEGVVREPYIRWEDTVYDALPERSDESPVDVTKRGLEPLTALHYGLTRLLPGCRDMLLLEKPNAC